MDKKKFINELYSERFLAGLHEAILITQKTRRESGYEIYYSKNNNKIIYPLFIQVSTKNSFDSLKDNYYNLYNCFPHSQDPYGKDFSYKKQAEENMNFILWKYGFLKNNKKSYPDFKGKSDIRNLGIDLNNYIRGYYSLDKGFDEQLLFSLHTHLHDNCYSCLKCSLKPTYDDLESLKHEKSINNHLRKTSFPIYITPVVNEKYHNLVPIILYQENHNELNNDLIKHFSKTKYFLNSFLLLSKSLQRNNICYCPEKNKNITNCGDINNYYNLDLGFYDLKKRSICFKNNLEKILVD